MLVNVQAAEKNQTENKNQTTVQEKGDRQTPSSYCHRKLLLSSS